MRRDWKLSVLLLVSAGAAAMTGCIGVPCGPYNSAVVMPRGAVAPCNVPESCGPCETVCDPCQGGAFPPGYYTQYGYGQPLRTGAAGLENGVNAVGNLVAGVVTFPFHLVGNLAKCTVAGVTGAGYYGCAGGGCSREVYCGEYGYQPQDSCDPCAGQMGMQGRTVHGGGDCGCSGGVPVEKSPNGDEVMMERVSTVRRPTSRVITASAYQSNLAPAQRVTQASFATPVLRQLPVR